jgi:hypothetical protein
MARYPKLAMGTEVIGVRLPKWLVERLRLIQKRRIVERGGEEVHLRTIVEEAIERSPIFAELGGDVEPPHITTDIRKARATRQKAQRRARA